MIRRIDKKAAHIYNEPPSHGMYEWCVKYYGWMYDWEKERARLYFLGEFDSGLQQFQGINKLVKRPTNARLAGENLGWLVVDENLSNEELARLDEYVENMMQELPRWLEQERYYFECETDKHNEQVVNVDEDMLQELLKGIP